MMFREKMLQKHCFLQAILATSRRRVAHMVATAIEEIRTPSASAVGEKNTWDSFFDIAIKILISSIEFESFEYALNDF